jgi:AraC-like DNA-binding protein
VYSLTGQRIGVKVTGKEWSRYYHHPGIQGLEVLHARFVEHRYPRHAHHYFVIAFVESGAASYRYRGAQHVAPAGHVFIVNPDEPHTGESAGPSGYLYQTVYPSADYLSRVAEDVGGARLMPFFKDSLLKDAHLAALLSRFHKSLAAQAPKAEWESLVLRALAHLVRYHADPRLTALPPAREHPAVRTACEYIEEHYAEDISLSTLGGLVALSPYYFSRAFERETGLPPHGYLENVRIRKAREFLDQGESLVSAALSAGYSDQSHFTHRFKRFLGVTPGQYVRDSKFLQDQAESKMGN